MMMVFRLLLAVALLGLVSSAGAYDFYVGGRDGWVVNPSESYAHWAGRNRFQVNDTLVFKYKKGEDSVLVVEKESFETCNLSSPIERLDGGDSVFHLGHSGPFYFISGAAGKCEMGQKLLIVVLAVRGGKEPFPATPPASSPSLSPVPSLPPSVPSESAPPGPSSSSSSNFRVSVGLVVVAVALGLAFLI